MRKLINWVKITFTGNKMSQYATMAVTITTTLLAVGSAAEAIQLSKIVGVEEDRKKVVSILNKLLPDFKSATTPEGRKGLAQRIGVEIIRDLDGGKSGKIDFYIEIFELFLKKAA